MTRVIQWCREHSQLCWSLGISVVILVCVLALVVNSFALFWFVGLETEHSALLEIRDRAGALQSIVTVVAIIFGGVIAGVKLQAFREFAPHVNVLHEIRYREINNTFIHLDVKASLHNSSKVRIEFRRAQFSIQQVLPATDEDVAIRHDEVFVSEKHQEMQWPVLDSIEHEWKAGEVVVEPGEQHSEVQEFIVPREQAETVKVITYFYDPRYSERPDNDQFGWRATTFVDTIVRPQAG